MDLSNDTVPSDVLKATSQVEDKPFIAVYVRGRGKGCTLVSDCMLAPRILYVDLFSDHSIVLNMPSQPVFISLHSLHPPAYNFPSLVS